MKEEPKQKFPSQISNTGNRLIRQLIESGIKTRFNQINV